MMTGIGLGDPRMLFAAVALFVASAPPALAQGDVGRTFPSEKMTLADRVTGRPMVALTSGLHSDAKLYPTHAQWTADGQWIVFRSSNRDSDGPQAFAVNEETGIIVQLTDGAGTGTGSLNVARHSQKIWYMRNDEVGGERRTRLIEVDLAKLLPDALAGTIKPEGYERVVSTLPKGHREAGGFSMDADEKSAYVGFDAREAPPRPPGQPVPQVPGGLRAIDLATGNVRTVIETPFRMGHVQASPFVSGEIMYCNETGGDAPQRMFIVKADGTGNRPLYPEGPDDWVTHEQFADADHVIFNLMGHTAKLRLRPSGVMVVSLRDGSVQPLGQLPPAAGPRPGGFWHNGVTFDGRYASADDFAGSVHFIDRRTGKRTLVSTGHRMQPDHAHPSFSADGARILIQSGMLTDGKRLVIMVLPVGDLEDPR